MFSVCILLLNGCGYSLNHRLKEVFDTQKKAIFIPIFTNNTEELGVEMIFTNAAIHELESHGEVTVSDRKSAGLEIRGTINSIMRGIEVFSGLGTSGERAAAPLQNYARIPDQIGVTAKLHLEVWDIVQNKIRYSGEFTKYRRVSAPLSRVSDWDAPSSLGPITQSIIESVYPTLARDIMLDLYDQMIDI